VFRGDETTPRHISQGTIKVILEFMSPAFQTARPFRIHCHIHALPATSKE